MRSWSIASRLVLYFTTASSLLLLGSMCALYWIVIRHINEADRLSLLDKAAALRADLAEDAGPTDLREELKTNRAGIKSGYFIRVLNAAGEVVAETEHMPHMLPKMLFPPPTELDQLARTMAEYRSPRGKWFLLACSTADAGGEHYTLQLAQDRSDDKRFTVAFRTLLVGVLAVGILVSAGMARLVAKRGLLPLEEMTKAVERVRATRLHERIGAVAWPIALPKELDSLTRAFDEMLDRLEESFTRLSQFSADLAHELRTPVANLRGEAEVALTKARTAEEYREVIESSVEECGQLSQMIDSLLFLARADATDAPIEDARFDARAEVNAIFEFYEALAQEQEVTFSLDAEGENGAMRGDPALFRRALSNVISNALKCTPRGGTITVSIKAQNEETLKISVSDTGCGISPEHLEKVFDRFYRVDTSRNSQGSGLGLAIVKSIMQLHGGSVAIESQPNEGTTVTLSFPK
jgi:two-component system heavy metal sensor histidine kinase CusS